MNACRFFGSIFFAARQRPAIYKAKLCISAGEDSWNRPLSDTRLAQSSAALRARPKSFRKEPCRHLSATLTFNSSLAGDASHHKAVRDAGAAEPVKTKNPSDDLSSGKKSRNNAPRLRTHLRLGIRQNTVQSGVHIDLLLTKIKGRLFDSLGEELFAGQRIQPCISRPIVLGERLFEHRRREPAFLTMPLMSFRLSVAPL